MTENNRMNIAFNVSQEHLKYAMVAIESLFKHNCPREIQIYIVTQGVDNASCNKITKYIHKKGSNVNFINFDSSLLEGFKSHQGNYTNYFRLYLHMLLGDELSRVLYLDDDIIVRQDLHDLYNLDFEDKALIAPYDIGPFIKKYLLKQHLPDAGLSLDKNIFCDGIMLINLDKYRELGINHETYLNCIKGTNNYHYDQGILNKLFCGEFNLTKLNVA